MVGVVDEHPGGIVHPAHDQGTGMVAQAGVGGYTGLLALAGNYLPACNGVRHFLPTGSESLEEADSPLTGQQIFLLALVHPGVLDPGWRLCVWDSLDLVSHVQYLKDNASHLLTAGSAWLPPAHPLHLAG